MGETTVEKMQSAAEEEVVLVVSDVPEPEPEEKTSNHDQNAQDKLPLSPPPPPEAESEDATKLSHLPDNEKKALQELKQLLQDSLHRHQLSISAPPPPPPSTLSLQEETGKDEQPSRQTIAKTLLEDDGAKTLEAIEETIVHSNDCAAPPAAAEAPAAEQAVFIWGVKLLEDERSDVVLLKFLRARDFKVKEAFTMLNNTLQWRKAFGIDELVKEEEEEESEADLERAVFMHGRSKDGHPICYNVYGEFRNQELYDKMFSDEEKRHKFLRWRIRFMEKSIRKLDFSHGGISTIIQINDLNNSPGPNRRELRQATNQALQLFQDNYPEFVAKQIFINVPWWYLALNKMISPFMTQRTKSKFVVAGPSKSAHTLFKYISAEQIPAQYGGLSKDGDFGVADSVTEVILKPSAKHIVEFPVNQECIVSWEARVVGWEVSYGAEFAPSAEDGYTVIIQKNRGIGSKEEQVVSSSYKVCENGKLLLTFNNPTSKKKMLLYRFKTKLCN